jgi:triacylglycerol lipase
MAALLNTGRSRRADLSVPATRKHANTLCHDGEARAAPSMVVKNTAGQWVVPSIGVRGMGSYTQSAAGRVAIDTRWFPNDGVVNTTSMKSPSGQPVRNYDGANVRGIWQHLGYYGQYDHFDVVGWLRPGSAVYPIFDNLSQLVYGL